MVHLRFERWKWKKKSKHFFSVTEGGLCFLVLNSYLQEFSYPQIKWSEPVIFRSVCLFACLSANFNVAFYFWSTPDTVFIFGMVYSMVKHFQKTWLLIPGDLNPVTLLVTWHFANTSCYIHIFCVWWY